MKGRKNRFIFGIVVFALVLTGAFFGIRTGDGAINAGENIEEEPAVEDAESFGVLIIETTLNEITQAECENLQFEVKGSETEYDKTFTLSGDNDGEAFETVSENESLSFWLTLKLEPDTYTVTQSSFAVEGYSCVVTADGKEMADTEPVAVNVLVTAGEEATASFVNDYTVPIGTLSLGLAAADLPGNVTADGDSDSSEETTESSDEEDTEEISEADAGETVEETTGEDTEQTAVEAVDTEDDPTAQSGEDEQILAILKITETIDGPVSTEEYEDIIQFAVTDNATGEKRTVALASDFTQTDFGVYQAELTLTAGTYTVEKTAYKIDSYSCTAEYQLADETWTAGTAVTVEIAAGQTAEVNFRDTYQTAAINNDDALVQNTTDNDYSDTDTVMLSDDYTMVQTGDSAPIHLVVSIMAVCMAGIAGLLVYRKKCLVPAKYVGKHEADRDKKLKRQSFDRM